MRVALFDRSEAGQRRAKAELATSTDDHGWPSYVKKSGPEFQKGLRNQQAS